MPRLGLLTYNCGKHVQDPAQFSRVVSDVCTPDTDVLIVAVQEATSIMEGALGWVDASEVAIRQSVPPVLEFVCSQWCGAVGVLIFARTKVEVLESRKVAVGYLWTSLKGAAAVRLLVDGVPMIVVSSHLPAGEESRNVDQRNAAWSIIASNLGLATRNAHIVLLGDLNYRARDGHDELDAERLGGRTLWMLSEAPRTFGPTYKFEVGSDIQSHKRRPSWCDRILFSSGEPDEYLAVTKYRASDHRPVYLRLKVTLQSVLPQVTTDMVVSSSRLPTEALEAMTWVVDSLLGRSIWLATTRRGLSLFALFVISIFFMR